VREIEREREREFAFSKSFSRPFSYQFSLKLQNVRIKGSIFVVAISCFE